MSLFVVPKATVDDETRESVLSVLTETLSLAESGEVTAVVIIAKKVDGTYWDTASGVDDFQGMIGSLEILKAQWIMQHLDKEAV
jgi:hypothetical protein